MNLTLHLSTDLEAQLQEQAQAQGKSPKELALEALRETLTAADKRTCMLPRAAWHAALQGLLTSLPSSSAQFVDDSRESIYEGCGE